MSQTSIAAHIRTALAELPTGAIVVACSGGVDSTVLLHALARDAQARERGLRALHVDHGLHIDSTIWSEHCHAAARALDVPFDSVRVEVNRNSGTGIEDAARAARLDAFLHHLQPGEILALAQHRDDQAETILLKLLRGAGPQGLGGMRALREWGDRGHLWRPLLDLPHSAVLDYAQMHALPFIDDPSNADTHLRRNFLRREILPRLSERWPDAPAALAHSARWARAAADFIETETRKALIELQGHSGRTSNTLNWQGWLNLPEALRDPVLRAWMRDLHLDEPTHLHVAELERQLRHSSSDRAPCVRFAATELRRYRDRLHAMHRATPLMVDWQSTWNGAPLPLPGGGSLELAPDIRLENSLQVRYRRGGERIKPAGRLHTRELRLLLQESGVPPWQRERLPLIYLKDELIAVADLYLSDAGEQLLREFGAHIVLYE